MNRIVVGVDGSECARRALAWAIDEAILRGGAEVVAVHAWSYPIIPAPVAPILPITSSSIDFKEEAHQTLEREIKEVTGGRDDVTIERHVVAGSAASELLRAAETADMLVVGSRGLGGFRGLLLGSVGQQCAQYARCPVVILPHDER